MNYYTNEGLAHSQYIRYKKYIIGEYIILKLGDVKFHIKKNEYITHIGLVDDMFSTQECVIEYGLKDFHINRHNTQLVELKEQMVRVPNKFIKE